MHGHLDVKVKHKFNVQYFFPEYHVLCEITWKNILEPNRLQMIIQYDTRALRAVLWRPQLDTHS